MEYLAVWTDQSYKDRGSSRRFSLDLECHSDSGMANEFRLKLPDSFMPQEGSAFYLDGTEWGGVVRDRDTDTRLETITWVGTTWHGVWAEKVLEPDAGQVRVSYSGSVSGAIGDLITRLGLGALFDVGQCPTQDVEHDYTRYPDGWEALQEVLAAVEMRPTFEPQHNPGGSMKVLVGAASSDVGELRGAADMGMSKAMRPKNHIIGLGKGEGLDRVVIHRYTDANGTISGTRTFSGLDDRTIRYESPESEYDDLLDQIDKRLAEAQEASNLSLYARGELGIGDRVSGYDPRTGESVDGTVTEVVVKASRYSLSVAVGTK